MNRAEPRGSITSLLHRQGCQGFPFFSGTGLHTAGIVERLKPTSSGGCGTRSGTLPPARESCSASDQRGWTRRAGPLISLLSQLTGSGRGVVPFPGMLDEIGPGPRSGCLLMLPRLRKGSTPWLVVRTEGGPSNG